MLTKALGLISVLLCASLAVAEDSTKTKSEAAPVLHEHPTLVSMLDENNAWRKSRGLAPQQMSAELTRAAQDHAWYMARSRDFSHYSNGGPWGRARRFRFFGNVRENIAMGHRNVRSVFGGWRNSSGHWASITCSAPLAGFGYAVSDNGAPYWVGMYGYPDGTRVGTVTR
jgi:uncharacterized protein YkwD